MIFVTGGAGFIGSNFVIDWLTKGNESIVNLDKLTYAGNLCNLVSVKNNLSYHFVEGDINNQRLLYKIFQNYSPRAVIHFAAESHVDRSIKNPEIFITTNVNGTFSLLKASLDYWLKLDHTKRLNFRFIHVSTDEVFGSLEAADKPFTELTRYSPNSPYSASKAASDHLARAYYHTYGLPTIVTNCSNNYGPFQFPEKFIPLVISNALKGNSIPIYGDGQNVRDWLFVADHCSALRLILAQGSIGNSYNIGGYNEITNIKVVNLICDLLDELLPNSNYLPHSSLIDFVKDRPGHDRRYAINTDKIRNELGWQPQEDFISGIRKTINWYLNNNIWMELVQNSKRFADKFKKLTE